MSLLKPNLFSDLFRTMYILFIYKTLQTNYLQQKETMPYKQGVTGSNPVGPTSSRISMEFPSRFLFLEISAFM